MKKKNQTSFASKYSLLIIMIVCIVMMLLSIVTNKASGPLRGIANYTVIPMQKGINNVGMWIGDFTKNFETLQDMKSKNNKLQEKVDNLTTENSRLQQETYELKRLQDLFKLDADYADYEKVGAHVIGNDTGNWFSTFTIDKGTNDGIAVDMNVMSGSGLVGIITQTGPDWAKVRSIIDDASNVSGMILSTSDTCIVSGDLKLLNEGKIKFKQLVNNENEVQLGEHIVTSHISDKYLQGILIGYVSEITVDSNNLTRSGYLTPAVDFKHLQEVLIITKLKTNPSDKNKENEVVKE